MKKSNTKMDRLLQLVQKQGMVRPRDLVPKNIPIDYLHRLYRLGLVDRVSRGLYAWPEMEVTEHHSLVEAARQVPRGVICLLSALRFYGLTTQSPHAVWMAIGPKAWKPHIESPQLQILRFSGKMLTQMVAIHKIEKVSVRIYTPAKTIADCFKYRNQIGLDVAIEALRDCWRAKQATMDDLWSAARLCRMSNVMRPYLESLV